MHRKRTKIVCTIGPASAGEAVLREMIAAGMNVARLNFSHGTYEDHGALIKKIRALSEKLDAPIAILQDLQGPKIRVGDLPEEGVELKAGRRIAFTTGEASVHEGRLPVTYERLHEDVKAGERMLMDDGLLSARVVEVNGRDVVCEVVDGGVLKSHKGINLPETSVSASSLSEKDKEDVRFGLSQDVDWLALSFVRSADAVRELKEHVAACERELGIVPKAPVRIIAKIEKREAVDRFDEILEAVDGVMVARGDLGIELPAEEVPIIQKALIRKCLSSAKPVVVATQMLDSMIRNPRPTRAEVSDAANAVIDHTDAVMLSGESATGKYPVEAVRTLSRIVSEAEASPLDDLDPLSVGPQGDPQSGWLAEVSSLLARGIKAKLILAASLTGATGRGVSRFRPELPIMVGTVEPRVRRQLSLSWGVEAFLLPQCDSMDELAERAVERLKEKGEVAAGDRAILIAGDPVGRAGHVNLIEVREIG